MVFGLELLSVNLSRVFHLTMVFSETLYCTKSSVLDFVLLFISLRKCIFVVALEVNSTSYFVGLFGSIASVISSKDHHLILLRLMAINVVSNLKNRFFCPSM